MLSLFLWCCFSSPLSLCVSEWVCVCVCVCVSLCPSLAVLPVLLCPPPPFGSLSSLSLTLPVSHSLHLSLGPSGLVFVSSESLCLLRSVFFHSFFTFSSKQFTPSDDLCKWLEADLLFLPPFPSFPVSFFLSCLFDYLWCLMSLEMLYTNCWSLFADWPRLAEVAREPLVPGLQRSDFQLAVCESVPPGSAVLNLKFGLKAAMIHFHILRYIFGLSDGSSAGIFFPVCYCWRLSGALLWKSPFLPFHFPRLLSYVDIFSPVQRWAVLQGSCFLIQWQDSK